MIRLSLPLLRRQVARHLNLAASAAVNQSQTQTWIQTPLTQIQPASSDSSLFHVTVDVSDSNLPGNFTAAGQYVQLRIPSSAKPTFLAIASPPELAKRTGVFEFLVKRIAGSTADMICEMREGEVVEIGGVMGRGFEIEKVGGSETVFIFATGSGISPIRSVIESGFNTNNRPDVRLYYGARNLERMAYQERFKDWEATGVKIIPVLSQPGGRWKGEHGYVQTAFSRVNQIFDPSSTGAMLCGHKPMTEDVASMLIAGGVSKSKILMNF